MENNALSITVRLSRACPLQDIVETKKVAVETGRRHRR